MAEIVYSLNSESADFEAAGGPIPLVVDLDGTFFVHDIFSTQVLSTLFKQPLLFLRTLFLVLTGKKAEAKATMVLRGPEVEISTWPVNMALEEKLKVAALNGRNIVLCSGSNQIYVDQVVDQKPYISSGFGSSTAINLTGSTKRDFLIREYGEAGFDYIGNSKADLPVYSVARKAFETHAYFDNRESSQNGAFRTWLKQLRVKHWTKNLLLFLPLVAAHDLSLSAVFSVSLFFILFSLQASGTYLINDLLDLQADVRHPDKRFRPIASGAISPFLALAAAVLLMVGPAIISAVFISPIWAALLLVYLATTLYYSVFGKRLFGLDIVLLALLYTYRILAGTIVINATISVWLLALTFFLFFSMASVKRFVELAELGDEERAAGRGYYGIDIESIAQVGAASGVAAVVVFMLYVSSAEVRVQYENPIFLLLAVPVLMYWVVHLWVSARRDLVHSDPIDWALKDKASWYCFVLFFVIALGTWALNWIA